MVLHAHLLHKLRARAERFDELTALIAQPEVANDGKKLRALLQERGALEALRELSTRVEAVVARRVQNEATLGEDDHELRELAREDLHDVEHLESGLEEEVKRALVAHPDDERRKVIVEIRAGVGGDEATLFARELYALYRRYCEAQGWKIEDLEVSTSEIGGFKEVVWAVEGSGAWLKLRFESGGHRVQRVPATEAQGRIHTSAATVAVMAEENDLELELRPEDLRIETMRAGGAGGQHVNKTESAVRITHVPTGLVAFCRDDRSQLRNRESAMRLLKVRVVDQERAKRDAERAASRKSQVGSGDRSQRIRTYNWPQSRVTDHRLQQNFPLEQILAGKLDPLFDALIGMERDERIAAL